MEEQRPDHVRSCLEHRDGRAQMEDVREQVLDAVTEAFNEFVFYDRKTDPLLNERRLTQLVRDGVCTKREIVEKFAKLIDGWDVSRSC
jgi:hypothetical protein